MSEARDLVGAVLEPFGGSGRRYRLTHRVRLGDVTPAGRLRLDAVVRYLQDVANDDAYDSGIDNPGAWVVRRTVVEVHGWPVLREDLELATWCSGAGGSWAERRTTVAAAGGARIEAASLWVQLDAASGRPARLGPDFAAVYGPSTQGRRVRAKLALGAGPGPDVEASVEPFPLRRCDLDVLGHVNNAVAWAMVEQALAARCDAGGRFELEHHQVIDAGASLRLVHTEDRLWVLDGARLAVAVLAAPLEVSPAR